MRRHLPLATAAVAASVAAAGLLPGRALAAGTPAAHAKRPPGISALLDKPVKGAAKLYLHGASAVQGKTVTVPGRMLHVTGFVRPYVAHQQITLTARLGTHQLSKHTLRIRPAGSGHAGEFVATVAAPKAGILHLTATHTRSPKLKGFTTGRGVEVLALDTGSKLYTTLVQQRLAALHIYMPISHSWDLQTELAVTAYHRLLGRGTSDVLDHATLLDLLNGQGAFDVRFPDHGRHAEGNLSDQLVALIDGSKVERIYPMSSGKPTTPTILGDYQIYRRTPGYLPDGMYYSDFFIRGYAIHGYDPAPDYPASHGCMRLPISDAISAFNWLGLGDWVDVYGAPDGSV